MVLLDTVYADLWSIYEGEGDCTEPRSWPFLHDLAAAEGLTSASRLLDAGCGRGDHSFALAARLGCHVTGVDLVAQRVHDAASRESRPPGTRFVQASIGRAPFAAGSFDFIWCVDVLLHLQDLAAACRQLHRVLRPGGRMLTLVTTETSLMQPGETGFYTRLGIAAESVRREGLERAFQGAGFTSVRQEELGAELLESADDADGSRELTRLARMRRHRDDLIAAWGPERYETIRAFRLWLVYQLLGKLTSTCYVLQKP